MGDFLVESIDVDGGAESPFAPCLLAEQFREPMFELADSGGQAGGAFLGGEQICFAGWLG